MIKIIALGNIKETFFKESVLEYQKRISKYTKLEIIEIKESDSLAKEKEAILKHIEPKDYVVNLITCAIERAGIRIISIPYC